jgi:hypothetical protein
MSEQWNTKFGPRRVRKDPPTLQEAIVAAEGLTDDVDGQVEIAASLMGLAPESIRAEMLPKPSKKSHSRMVAGKQGALRTVIVERRSLRRSS